MRIIHVRPIASEIRSTGGGGGRFFFSLPINFRGPLELPPVRGVSSSRPYLLCTFPRAAFRARGLSFYTPTDGSEKYANLPAVAAPYQPIPITRPSAPRTNGRAGRVCKRFRYTRKCVVVVARARETRFLFIVAICTSLSARRTRRPIGLLDLMELTIFHDVRTHSPFAL